MEGLKDYALKQIDDEVNILRKEVSKNNVLKGKIKQNNLIGYPKTLFELEQENKRIENQIKYLLTQRKEILNNR